MAARFDIEKILEIGESEFFTKIAASENISKKYYGLPIYIVLCREHAINDKEIFSSVITRDYPAAEVVVDFRKNYVKNGKYCMLSGIALISK